MFFKRKSSIQNRPCSKIRFQREAMKSGRQWEPNISFALAWFHPNLACFICLHSVDRLAASSQPASTQFVTGLQRAVCNSARRHNSTLNTRGGGYLPMGSLCVGGGISPLCIHEGMSPPCVDGTYPAFASVGVAWHKAVASCWQLGARLRASGIASTQPLQTLSRGVTGQNGLKG